MDTIFAQSSAKGKAGVSVFRISGKDSLYAIKRLLKLDDIELTPKLMYNKKIYDVQSHELIDNVLVVFFQSPKSFTGEDIIEIHAHGSISITNLITQSLLNISGLRIAEPGEFAKRAFLNGKFDLTAAEGLADLIEAETLWQHRQAIRQASGDLEKLYDSWRQKLLQIISLLEAYIDFPDEDIPHEVLTKAVSIHKDLEKTIVAHLDDGRRGELLRDGIKLAIIGRPNVGKSSLLNFLMQREIAIVSNIAGTTRDVIEGHLDIAGYPIILHDTAGIRNQTADIIEQEGIKRAIEVAQCADIVILLSDPSSHTNNNDDLQKALANSHVIDVMNKVDLVQDYPNTATSIDNEKYLKISVKKQVGLDNLIKKIADVAGEIANISEAPQITRARHRHQLKVALTHLSNLDIFGDLVLATEDIRMTIRAIGSITGLITVDDILGEIFANFCIGK